MEGKDVAEHQELNEQWFNLGRQPKLAFGDALNCLKILLEDARTLPLFARERPT